MPFPRCWSGEDLGSERRRHRPPRSLSTPAAPHLRRQQERGPGPQSPLQGGLLGRVPEPLHRVLQHEGRCLRPSHLLQDPPQLLGVQRGHTHGTEALARKSGVTAAAIPGLRLRSSHGCRSGVSNPRPFSGSTEVRHPGKDGIYECATDQDYLRDSEAGPVLNCRPLAEDPAVSLNSWLLSRHQLQEVLTYTTP